MNNTTDKRYFKTSNLDNTINLKMSKRSELLSNKKIELETNLLKEKNQNSFTDISHESNVNCQNLFKAPNFDCLPVKIATVKSIKSPQKRIQTKRVKNDLKTSQQTKMSLIPRPSFINNRKSLHGSRCNQLNTRKELIKKMVFLAECSLKENKQIKQSTPVKMLAGLTPKKTPRSGGYFILPEFQKKIQKQENLRSPIQDLIKKEMFAYSFKPNSYIDKNKITPLKKSNDIIKVEDDKSIRFEEILHQCKIYNTEVNVIHEKFKILDDDFEKKIKNIPDYRIYNEFCFYQLKKEELYKKLEMLETDLRNFVMKHTIIGSKLEFYINKRREVFDREVNLHKEFENVIIKALEEEKSKMDESPPKLRRSLRLSKIKKNKFEERTPVTKKLKKLDIKSKGIQKVANKCDILPL